jgi:hypothetical protein
MSVIDRTFDLDKPAEAATAGDGRKEAGSDVPVESRTRGECYADLRQAAESGWDRRLKFDAPRGELARFKPERAGLPEVSAEESDRYVKRYRDERPWLQVVEGASPEVRRVFAAADMGGVHGHVRHEGWVSEEASMRRAARLEDPAQLDPGPADGRTVEVLAAGLAGTAPERDEGDGSAPADPDDGLRCFARTVADDGARERDGGWLGGTREWVPNSGPVPSSRLV